MHSLTSIISSWEIYKWIQNEFYDLCDFSSRKLSFELLNKNELLKVYSCNSLTSQHTFLWLNDGFSSLCLKECNVSSRLTVADAKQLIQNIEIGLSPKLEIIKIRVSWFLVWKLPEFIYARSQNWIWFWILSAWLLRRTCGSDGSWQMLEKATLSQFKKQTSKIWKKYQKHFPKGNHRPRFFQKTKNVQNCLRSHLISISREWRL